MSVEIVCAHRRLSLSKMQSPLFAWEILVSGDSSEQPELGHWTTDPDAAPQKSHEIRLQSWNCYIMYEDTNRIAADCQ